MPDYKELYFNLFAVQSKVIELLTQAAQEAEEMAINPQDAVRLMQHVQTRYKEIDEQEQKNEI